MKRYLIERHIPGVGNLTAAQYKALAATSNAAVAKLAGSVQWVQSYIAADNTFASTSLKARTACANTRGSPAFRSHVSTKPSPSSTR